MTRSGWDYNCAWFMGKLENATPPDAGAQLRQNIRELMRIRKWTQADLADKLGRSQPWVSKRMAGINKFSEADLDALAAVFEPLSPYELLQPGLGRFDRRITSDRRTGRNRRQSENTVATDSEAIVFREYTKYADASPSPHSPLELAHILTTLAEHLQHTAAALLRRHAATLGDSPADGPQGDPGVRGTGSHPDTRKTG